jgi:cytochrome c oxidase subunit 2
MAIPAAETLVRLEDGRKPDLTVVITGYQWRWHYAYQGQDVSFYSSLARESMEARHKNSGIDPFSVDNYLLDVDHRLILPKDAKVRVLITSNDVVHSWWVPELAIKKDAVPGFINEAWFRAEQTGVFRGQCAELCGMDHGYMPIVVEIVEDDDFQAWLQHEQGGAAKLASAK